MLKKQRVILFSVFVLAVSFFATKAYGCTWVAIRSCDTRVATCSGQYWNPHYWFESPDCGIIWCENHPSGFPIASCAWVSSWACNTSGVAVANWSYDVIFSGGCPSSAPVISCNANGVCGSANSGTFAAEPKTNLCSTGSPTAVASGNGPWNWTCNGSGTGSPISCSANKPGPTADIKANGSNSPSPIDYNTAVTISWTSASVDSCTVSNSTPPDPDWTGRSNPSQTTGNLKVSTTYTLNCTGPNGDVPDNVIVNVTPPPVPTLTFTGTYGAQINQTTLNSVPANASVTLNWTTNASTTFCDAWGGDAAWNTYNPSNAGGSSSRTVPSTLTYSMRCWNSVNVPTEIKTVQVNVCNNTPGICGSAAGGIVCTAPTSNLCNDGATPVVSGSGPYSWTCPGSCGGGNSPLCTTTAPSGCVSVSNLCPVSCGGGTKVVQHCEKCSGGFLTSYDKTQPCNEQPCLNEGYKEVAPW